MRKELEDIIFLGRQTTTVEILGKIWTLQTIDVLKYTNVVKQINTNDNALNLILLKKNIVKEALVSIDDVVIKDNERESFINSLPFAIIDKLFVAYDNMTSQLNKQLTQEDIEEIKN